MVWGLVEEKGEGVTVSVLMVEGVEDSVVLEQVAPIPTVAVVASTAHRLSFLWSVGQVGAVGTQVGAVAAGAPS
jgi:hypothetical protein